MSVNPPASYIRQVLYAKTPLEQYLWPTVKEIWMSGLNVSWCATYPLNNWDFVSICVTDAELVLVFLIFPVYKHVTHKSNSIIIRSGQTHLKLFQPIQKEASKGKDYCIYLKVFIIIQNSEIVLSHNKANP